MFTMTKLLSENMHKIVSDEVEVLSQDSESDREKLEADQDVGLDQEDAEMDPEEVVLEPFHDNDSMRSESELEDE